MKKFLIKILVFSMIADHIFRVENSSALIPYYNLPTTKTLEQESLSIGKQFWTN